MFIVWYPREFSNFPIYTPGIGTLSYTVSSALGRIQHIWAANAICFLQFSSHQVSIPAG